MGLGNTPGFFQHRMKKVLEKYLWKFVLVYVDDIIIYSPTLENHLVHLEEILIQNPWSCLAAEIGYSTRFARKPASSMLKSPMIARCIMLSGISPL
jgi:hypothetical protein